MAYACWTVRSVVASCLFSGLLMASLPAAAARLRVRGVTTVEARAFAQAGKVEIRGRLLDDAGRPVAAQKLSVRWREAREGAARPLPPSEACAPTPHVHSARGFGTAPDEDVVETDPAGRFCLRFPNAAPGGVIEVSYAGDGFYAAQSAMLDVDSNRRALGLHFAPEPTRISLDRALYPIWIETELEPPLLATEDSGPIQLDLSFSSEGRAPEVVGTATLLRPGERAEFELESRKLGAPGPGVLRVRFAGSDSIQPAERSVVVQRTSRVALALAGRVERGDPHEGIEIRVAVGSAQGAVSSGSVEARIQGDSVGAAPVNAGVARVVAVFDAPHGGEVELTLHYLPAAPWWEPGAPLSAVVPVAPPSPWRRLPWLLAAAAIAVWVVRGWRRPERTDKPLKESTAKPPPGRAVLDVVAAGPLHSGWRGVVLDAHEGAPIAGARVAVLVPAFGGDGVAAAARTDQAGYFELPDVAAAGVEGARMEASAPWHATLSNPVPPAGEVSINLVARRRALLERLVEWATRRGPPWKSGGDPTPGQIAQLGRHRRADDVAGWADEVEQAAYGPEPPDEAAERRVRAREPRWE